MRRHQHWLQGDDVAGLEGISNSYLKVSRFSISKIRMTNVTWSIKISATYSLFLLYSTIVVVEGLPDNIYSSNCHVVLFASGLSTAQSVVPKFINDMTTTHLWAFGCGGNIGNPSQILTDVMKSCFENASSSFHKEQP